MSTEAVIKVPLHYRVVRVRPAGPFHWALLRTLQVFPPGVRPGLDELTTRLHIGEPAFLADAWRELTGWHAVDDANFLQARLTLEGGEALRSGRFVLGRAEERVCVVAFTKEGKWLEQGPAAAPAAASPLKERPSWADGITTAVAERILRDCVSSEALRPDECRQDVWLEWGKALISRARPAGRG